MHLKQKVTELNVPSPIKESEHVEDWKKKIRHQTNGMKMMLIARH